jgi:Rap1a immunity proteins
MGKLSTFGCAFALIFLAYAPAFADTLTSENWSAKCARVDFEKKMPNEPSPIGVMDFAYCLAFTLAVADTLQFVSNGAALGVCIPKGVPVLLLVEIGQKFLKENPNYRPLVAATVLTAAFKDAFPCKP